MASPATITITAEEVNCLIFAYLRDSGFTHSAYTVSMEAHLERSPFFSKHIPRGELVELLSKSLLYLEAESHWSGGALAANCQSPFSLLEQHVCSLEPPSTRVPHHTAPGTLPNHGLSSKTNGTDAKRKASPSPVDGPIEKRVRRDIEDMDVDSSSEKPRNASPAGAKKVVKKTRLQGPRDESTSNAISLLSGHSAEVFVCAFNPANYKILATGSKDAAINMWFLPDPTDVTPQEFDPPITFQTASKLQSADLTSLHWNPEGTLLAAGSYDATLRVCSTSGEMYFQESHHDGPIFAARFSKSGKWLVTASLDGKSCLWDVAAKKLERIYRCHSNCCLDVEWITDDIFASCGADRLIYIMRTDEPNPIKTLSGHASEINQMKCNPSLTRLASCSDDITARVWKVDNLDDSIPGLVASEHVVILSGHKHAVSTVAWCPVTQSGSNECLATTSFDGTARLWDSVSGECLRTFADHKRPVYALKFSPNGQWLATGGGDGWMHIYNFKSGAKKWSWYAGSEKPGVFEIEWQIHNEINRIALALECRQVAVIDVNKIPALLEVETQEVKDTLPAVSKT